MTDRQIDFLIAASDPAGAARDDDAPLSPAEQELRDAIASSPAPPRRARVRWPAGTLARRAVAVGLVGAAALGAAAYAGIDRVGDGSQPAWAAPVLRAAQASPRMLIGEGGWTITRADEFGARFGETEFSNGRETVHLRWYPAAGRSSGSPSKGSGTTAVPPTTLDGARVAIVRYDDSDRYRAAWPSGRWTMELDGAATSPARFAEIVRSLRGAGVDEWLSAMPASAVRPDARPAAVDGMLAGVPLPPGFDVASLRAGAGQVKDRYQLGAEVSGTVACAWIGRWVDARASGDAPGARAAVAAMATAHGWAVLRGMDAEGDYPEVLWQLADAMGDDADVPAGKPGVTVADAYRDALGCAP